MSAIECLVFLPALLVHLAVTLEPEAKRVAESGLLSRALRLGIDAMKRKVGEEFGRLAGNGFELDVAGIIRDRMPALLLARPRPIADPPGAATLAVGGEEELGGTSRFVRQDTLTRTNLEHRP